MAEIRRVIALGFFDGVHIGHGALLKKTAERAKELGITPSVLSFDVHPDKLVFGKDVPLINSALSREEIIRRCYGIDDVIFVHFNQRMMRMPWQDFADTIIMELGLAWIVVGHDFCFGYRGEGTAEKLKAYCELATGARERRKNSKPTAKKKGSAAISSRLSRLTDGS